MAPKIIDPLSPQQALKADRGPTQELSAAEVAIPKKRPRAKAKAKAEEAERVWAATPTKKEHTEAEAVEVAAVAKVSTEEAIKKDFRLFLVLLWRHLLGCDPNPAQLDMAWYLQHGPDRSVILAFRGFSKSWITGAYALWRLYCDPQEKILVVSGSLTRAVATTNWCLQLIMTWPLLKRLIPMPDQRQSSKAFDVGPATPAQSPSFHALGIGGQIVGFRGTCIIPDDVETQQNSLTVTMREKNREAVKEFDSVLVPGGVIKYLGTPHDEDSLYNELPKRGYDVRIWPGLFPTEAQVKRYGGKLSPWITLQLAKDPSLVGRSIMSMRFTDDDLAKRKLSLGTSEFALQFMLDTSLTDRDKYPLKYRDLMVAALDPRKGPDTVVWSDDPAQRVTDIQRMGFEGDHIHKAIIPPDTQYSPYTRIIGAVDNSGRGQDETSLCIFAELHGIIFWLHLWASKAGYEPPTLKAIAEACVRFNVQKLRLENNFGDGMFTQLLKPVLEREWTKYHNAQRKVKGHTYVEVGGTEIEEVRASNQMAKERRILSVMEPITQQHRIVVDRKVLEYDFESLENIEGTDSRHHYSFGHQFSHLTRDRDCLVHDDRLDSAALGIADFADILGVDPGLMAASADTDRYEAEMEKLFGELDEDDNGILKPGSGGTRAVSLGVTRR